MCVVHGGKAPQVKAKALERLAALVDPAIERLAELLSSETDNVALGAVKDVLDRNDLKSAEKLQLTGAGGGPIAHVDYARLTEDELRTIQSIFERAGVAENQGGTSEEAAP